MDVKRVFYLLNLVFIKTSKKTLAFSTKLILSHFLQDIKSYIANQSIHISLISPSRVRKKILQQIWTVIAKKYYVLHAHFATMLSFLQGLFLKPLSRPFILKAF